MLRTMKLIIVDLYGDGDALRVMEDTPRNDQLIKDWEQMDHKYCENPMNDEEYRGFTEFMEEAGVQLMETRRIDLGP
jgi:hypothetical protein